MQIGVISDTHGYLDEKVFEYFSTCDEIWHAGDIGDRIILDKLMRFKPMRAVYGNIDGMELRAILDEEIIFEIEGLRVWLIHIAGYPSHYAPAVKKRIREIRPNLLVCGHSHILRVMTDKNLENFLYINPGAAGFQGFHKTRTLIRFSIIDKLVGNMMEVIELGPRWQGPVNAPGS